MSHAYRLASHKVLSDIELPELLPWNGVPSAPVELRFRLGRVPANLDAPDHKTQGFETQGAGRYLLSGADRILVEHGSWVTVDPASGTDLIDARALLMGPVQAVLWHQRGLLPLHASVVAVEGKAVALAGPSGVGKSTLAAALSLKGHPVLADDMGIIDTAHGAEVLLSTNRLRLWRDALQHFDIPAKNLPRALSRNEKYLIEGGEQSGSERRILSAIIILSKQGNGTANIKPLRGARSILRLAGVVHMTAAARALGLGPAVFAALTKLPTCGVKIRHLRMPEELGCLNEAASLVLAALEG